MQCAKFCLFCVWLNNKDTKIIPCHLKNKEQNFNWHCPFTARLATLLWTFSSACFHHVSPLLFLTCSTAPSLCTQRSSATLITEDIKWMVCISFLFWLSLFIWVEWIKKCCCCRWWTSYLKNAGWMQEVLGSRLLVAIFFDQSACFHMFSFRRLSLLKTLSRWYQNCTCCHVISTMEKKEEQCEWSWAVACSNEKPMLPMSSFWRCLHLQKPCPVPAFSYFAVFRTFLGVNFWAVGV